MKTIDGKDTEKIKDEIVEYYNLKFDEIYNCYEFFSHHSCRIEKQYMDEKPVLAMIEVLTQFSQSTREECEAEIKRLLTMNLNKVNKGFLDIVKQHVDAEKKINVGFKPFEAEPAISISKLKKLLEKYYGL